MPQKDPKSSARGKLDLATVFGLLVALGGIVGGLMLEGGKLSDISQLTAAMIVLGGTVGAVMVTTPLPTLKAAVHKLPSIVWQPNLLVDHTMAEILRFAARARRTGVVSLESEAEEISDPFFRKALLLAVDGTDLKVVRRVMELELESIEQQGEAAAKVFESAGGYAPTVGIIGAVLGLIQVMKHLEDIEAVGHGIAVAFVATVYGVSVSNLLFLPFANKLKARLQQSLRVNELTLEGVIAIVEGLNPKLIESKLEPFRNALSESTKKPGSKSPVGSQRAAA
jgi:chemotaxis protein MotA